MRRTIVFVAAVLADGAFVFAGVVQAGRPGTGAIREAALTDAQVVLGPDDSGGFGEARFIFYPNKHKICYTIQVSGIARATSAHPHEVPAAQVGPVRLNPPRDGASEHECIRDLGERFIRRISGNPTGYYVDIHNEAFTDGAVRGQLTRGGPR